MENEMKDGLDEIVEQLAEEAKAIAELSKSATANADLRKITKWLAGSLMPLFAATVREFALRDGDHEERIVELEGGEDGEQGDLAVDQEFAAAVKTLVAFCRTLNVEEQEFTELLDYLERRVTPERTDEDTAETMEAEAAKEKGEVNG